MRYKTIPANLFNPEILFRGIFELFCGVGWDICEPTFWLIIYERIIWLKTF